MKIFKFTPLLFALLLFLVPLVANAHSDYGLEWRGTLTSRPAGTAGTWVVGTMSFQATTGTWINTEHGVPVVGSCVSIHYYPSGGVNVATKIETESAYKCGTGGGYGSGYSDDYDGGYDHHEGPEYDDEDDDSHGGYGTRGLWKSYGIVNSLPAAPYYGTWRIGVTNYTANGATRFEQKHRYFSQGTCVEFKQVGGILLEVETSEPYHCNNSGSTSPGQHYTQRYGVVNAFPANMVGTWTISGTLYTTTAATRFEQERGPFFVGSCVELKLQNVTLAVLEISQEDAYKCVNTVTYPIERKFYGVLTGTVPAGYVGDWDISDGTFHSPAAPTIDTSHGELTPDTCVDIEYESGENITHISSNEPYKCNTNTYANQVYGTLNSFPAGLYGTWIINGDNSYNANSSTRFSQSHGAFTNGVCVKVKYYVQNGIHHALEIETENSSHCGSSGTPSLPDNYIKLYATIDSFPANPYTGAWSIGGIGFTANSATRFDQSHAAFANGVCVEAQYQAGAAAPYTLLKVEGAQSYKCNQSKGVATPEFKSYGYVETMPTGTLTGMWQVSGVSYTANAATRFEQNHGFFTTGAYVEVKYTISGVDKVATSIETHVAPGSGLKVIAGTLDTMPDDKWDDWVIDGKTYHADPDIHVSDDTPGVLGGTGISASAAPAQGQPVLVTMYTNNGVDYIVSAALSLPTYLPLITK